MGKLPEHWGKGELPKGWAQNDHVPSPNSPKDRGRQIPPKEELPPDIPSRDTEPETPQESFLTEDEIKAKLDSAVSGVDQKVTQTADLIAGSLKSFKKTVKKRAENAANTVKGAANTVKDAVKADKSPDIQSDLSTTETTAEKAEKGSKSRRKIGSLLLVVAVIAAIVIFAVVFWILNGNNEAENIPSGETSSTVSQDETAEVTDSADPSIDSNEATESDESTDSSSASDSTEEPSEPGVQLSEYIGYWHFDESLFQELTIIDADEHTVHFSLWYLRTASFETIAAELDGNVASFVHATNSAEDYIKGSLAFLEDSIELTITEINNPYLSTGSTLFNRRHSQSWEKEGYEDEYQSGYRDPSEEDPNVFCPNCGYGWYTTGVGTDGFECPECHYKFNIPVDSHSQEFFEICGYYVAAYAMHETGEGTDPYAIDGEMTLTSAGSGFLTVSETEFSFNWDVGKMWDPSSPSEIVRFDVDGETLTMYIGEDDIWVFQKNE